MRKAIVIILVSLVIMVSCVNDAPKDIKAKYMGTKMRLFVGTTIEFVGEDGTLYSSFDDEILYQVRALRLYRGDVVTITVEGSSVRRVHGDYIKAIDTKSR